MPQRHQGPHVALGREWLTIARGTCGAKMRGPAVPGRLEARREGKRVMADRDSPPQLRGGMVAANGRVAMRDTDAIVAEIERTRQNLAHTIDSLAERVSPAGNMRRLRERATDQVARPEVQLAAVAAVLLATGFVAYRIARRHRA